MVTEENVCPCKYCGTMDLKLEEWDGWYGIVCQNVFCSRMEHSFYRTRDLAIRGWNARESKSINALILNTVSA